MPKKTNFDHRITFRVDSKKHEMIVSIAGQINEDTSEFYRKAAEERYEKLAKKLKK